MLQDFRFGLRMLARNPGLTAVMMGTLALAIGMNTAIFSVVHTALFRPLPYPGAERLVWLGVRSEREKRDIHVGRGSYRVWKQARSFEAMAAYGNDDFALVAGSEATQERIASVTGDFWPMTGGRTALGRLFADGEADSLVLSWNLFQRRFAGDATVIGRPVTVNGHPFTVVGVLAQDYRFALPQQYAEGREVEGYIAIPEPLLALPHPISYTIWEPAVRRLGPAPYALHVVARLRAGVDMGQARAEMQAIYDADTRLRPGIDEGFKSFRFSTLQDKLSGGSRRALLVLMVAAGFVLLIACANVANLLLTRATARRREIAIRTALGSSKLRLIRQMLAESLLLATGGLLGLALARWALHAIRAIAPHAVPGLAETAIDGPVLWFTLAASLATGFVFGLGPAFVLWRADVHEILKSESAASGRGRTRSLEALAALELALAIVLLTGAGLMLKSLWRMNTAPPGFTPEKILAMRITLSGPQYGAWPPKQQYTEELLRRLQSTPGVEAAGIHSGSMNTTVRVGGADQFAAIRGVSPGYLRAMGAPLVQGAWPAEGSLFGVVVNEAFARQAGGAVAGKHIGGFILNETITGVVADVKASQLDANPPPEVYVPYERLPVNRSMRVMVRTAGLASAVATDVRERVRQIDPTQPVYEFQTLEQALSDSIAPRRFNLFLLGVFAATAVLLAAIGIYGVIAYSVAQRTREIGVRMALGAGRMTIAAMVVRQGMTVAVAGIAVGVGASAALTRVMASLLYDVKPNDAPTFAAVAILFGLTALAACGGPALRAASVDPIVALRHE